MKLTIISELFDTRPVNLTYDTNHNDHIYTFNVADQRYNMSFKSNKVEKGYSVTFENRTVGYRGYSVTGTGNEQKVFASVLYILNDFISKINPNVLAFGSDGRSRNKLYRALLRKIPNPYKYVEIAVAREYNLYIIYKPHVEKLMQKYANNSSEYDPFVDLI